MKRTSGLVLTVIALMMGAMGAVSAQNVDRYTDDLFPTGRLTQNATIEGETWGIREGDTLYTNGYSLTISSSAALVVEGTLRINVDNAANSEEITPGALTCNGKLTVGVTGQIIVSGGASTLSESEAFYSLVTSSTGELHNDGLIDMRTAGYGVFRNQSGGIVGNGVSVFAHKGVYQSATGGIPVKQGFGKVVADSLLQVFGRVVWSTAARQWFDVNDTLRVATGDTLDVTAPSLTIGEKQWLAVAGGNVSFSESSTLTNNGTIGVTAGLVTFAQSVIFTNNGVFDMSAVKDTAWVNYSDSIYSPGIILLNAVAQAPSSTGNVTKGFVKKPLSAQQGSVVQLNVVGEGNVWSALQQKYLAECLLSVGATATLTVPAGQTLTLLSTVGLNIENGRLTVNGNLNMQGTYTAMIVGTIPGGGQLTIGTGGNFYVNDDAFTADNITIVNNGRIEIRNGTFLNDGSQVSGTGMILIQGTGSWQGTKPQQGILVNTSGHRTDVYGTNEWTAAWGSRYTVDDTLWIDVNASLHLPSNVSLTVPGDGHDSALFIVDGVFTVDGTLEVNGKLENNGTLYLDSGLIRLSGAIINKDTASAYLTGGVVQGVGRFGNSGYVERYRKNEMNGIEIANEGRGRVYAELRHEWLRLSSDTVYYEGEFCRPVSIVDGNKSLLEREDYTITYVNNDVIGIAEAYIEGIGDYYFGKDTVSFHIVNNVPVESITLDKTSVLLSVGETEQLRAVVMPDSASNKTVLWQSSDPNIVSVSDDGLITARAAGNVTITATAAGGKQDRCVVAVSVPVEGVTLEGPEQMIVGQSSQFIATVQPDNATIRTVTWSSNSESVATVDNNGVVTALAAGTTVIIVTTLDGNKQARMMVDVYTVPVTGIALDKHTELLGVYDTLRLFAAVIPDSATHKGVHWSSNNESIATVSQDGLVTGAGRGTTSIIASTQEGGFEDTCIVTVDTIAVTGVRLSDNDKTVILPIGQTRSLIANITPRNATNKQVRWQSTYPAIASVDSLTGLLTAHSLGMTVITVTTEEGGYSDIGLVEVSLSIPVSGVTLNTQQAALAVGDTAQLVATVLPDYANDKTVTWASGNNNVATVTPDGLVTAVWEGTTFITVTTSEGGFKDSCEITVFTTGEVIHVEQVTLNATTLYLQMGTVGQQLVANITPSDATNQTVIWTSNNESVATVTQNGMVTALTPGSATIIATTIDGGKTDACVITVQAPDVTGVMVNPGYATLAKGDTVRLTAIVLPSNTSDYAVQWTSDNSAIASVDNDGLVRALSAGTANITVATLSGNYTATCLITVKDQSVVIETTSTAPISGAGTIEFYLDVPTKALFTGSFRVTLPQGLVIDESRSALMENLNSMLRLTPMHESEQVWLFTISRLTSDGELPEAASKIISIVYNVDGTVNGGVYEAAIEDLTLLFNGNTVTKAPTTVSIMVTSSGGGAGVAPTAPTISAVIADNVLYISSDATERIDLYSVDGALLHSVTKPAGLFRLPVDNLPNGVLLIKGASGWVRKTVK